MVGSLWLAKEPQFFGEGEELGHGEVSYWEHVVGKLLRPPLTLPATAPPASLGLLAVETPLYLGLFELSRILQQCDTEVAIRWKNSYQTHQSAFFIERRRFVVRMQTSQEHELGEENDVPLGVWGEISFWPQRDGMSKLPMGQQSSANIRISLRERPHVSSLPLRDLRLGQLAWCCRCRGGGGQK